MHQQYGDRVQFVSILIRQAHPGGEYGPYRTYAEKVASAREYKQAEGLTWTVLVDDLTGTVHTTYGSMADSFYLIDATGQVAFYGMWAHAPTLKQALDQLLERGGQGGPIASGIDHTPHLVASFVNGWHGVSRGGPRALLDYEVSVPGGATLTFLGNLARPLLTPLTLRAAPLPMAGRMAVSVGVAASAAVLVGIRRRKR